MEIRTYLRENPAFYGWCAVAGLVIAWDVLAPQTLSSYADRLLENPNTRWIPWAVGGIVAGHVLNVTPPKLDPIQRAGDWVYRRFISGQS